MSRWVHAAGATATLGAATLGYAAGVERTAYRLRRFQVPVLAADAEPLTLLHVSDVHMLARQTAKQAWVRDLARLAPDLVVSTGDHLAGPDGVAAMLAAFAPLLTFPGVFVLGSNDYFAPVPKNPFKYFNPRHTRVEGPDLPWPALVAGLTAAGWVDVTNRRATLRVAGRQVEIRGVDDPHLHRDHADAVAGPPAPGTDLALGLVHAPEPRVLDRYVGDGVRLVLSGHTHGGQLRIPGLGALVTNCGIDRARCRGLSAYGVAGRWGWLHVSAGLGTSPYAPVRFACPPEASLLTMVAGPG